MTEETQEQVVGWDDAIETGDFVQFESGKTKKLLINGWKLVKCKKTFGDNTEERVEFRSLVLQEDGKKVEKEFNTVSNRLKAELKKVLENKDPQQDVVALSIIKVGESFDTKYAVELLKGEQS